MKSQPKRPKNNDNEHSIVNNGPNLTTKVEQQHQYSRSVLLDLLSKWPAGGLTVTTECQWIVFLWVKMLLQQVRPQTPCSAQLPYFLHPTSILLFTLLFLWLSGITIWHQTYNQEVVGLTFCFMIKRFCGLSSGCKMVTGSKQVNRLGI